MKHVSAELNRVEEIGVLHARKREVSAEREAKTREALTLLPSETPDAVAARENALELREALAESAPKRPAPLPCRVTLAVKRGPVVTIPEHARKGAAQCAAGFANLNGDLATLLAAQRAGVVLLKVVPDAKPRTARAANGPAAEKVSAVKSAKPEKMIPDVDLLDMLGGIVRATAVPIEAREAAGTIGKLASRVEAMRAAGSLGAFVGVDIRPEGVREREIPEEKHEAVTWAVAWLRGAPVELPEWWQGKGERFISAKLGKLILDGQADRAVMVCEGARQVELLPYRGKVQQVGANGIARPTAERFGWAGADNARPDPKDRFVAAIVVPTMLVNSRGQSFGSGDSRRIEQKFSSEAQARAWVVNALEVQHAYEGTIASLGKAKLAVKDGANVLDADERFEVIPAEANEPEMAVISREVILLAETGVAAEVIPGARNIESVDPVTGEVTYTAAVPAPHRYKGPAMAPSGSNPKKGHQRVKLADGRYARRYSWQKARNS